MVTNKKPQVMFDFMFPADSYQIIKIDKQFNDFKTPGSLQGLYFSGIFNVELHPDSATTIVNDINLNRLKVYFTN